MDKRRIVNVGTEISGLVNAAELLALDHSIRERNRIGSFGPGDDRKEANVHRFSRSVHARPSVKIYAADNSRKCYNLSAISCSFV